MGAKAMHTHDHGRQDHRIIAKADELDIFDDGPGKTGKVMIWSDGCPKQMEWRWGFKPLEPGGGPVSLLRWEGRAITNPCLIIANDFGLRTNGRIKYRASLITDQPFFCLAGVWRPATDGWPESYAALTTEAYPDIAPFKDRHVAVIREDEWYDWLQLSRPVEELLRPFPRGSFEVTTMRGRPASRPAAVTGDLFGW
jgi:putative SOS response-associated peptidase YedK